MRLLMRQLRNRSRVVATIVLSDARVRSREAQKLHACSKDDSVITQMLGICACLRSPSPRPQAEHWHETGQDASPATRHRRLSEADVFKVRRRNADMLRRRRSCADAAEERVAAQRARMRRLSEQVRVTSLQVCARLLQSRARYRLHIHQRHIGPLTIHQGHVAQAGVRLAPGAGIIFCLHLL